MGAWEAWGDTSTVGDDEGPSEKWLGRHPCQSGNLTRRGIDTIAGSLKKVDAVSFNDKDSILEVFRFAG